MSIETSELRAEVAKLTAERDALRELLTTLSSAAKAYGDAQYFEDDEELEDMLGPRLIAAIEAADDYTKGTDHAPSVEKT